MKKQITLLAFLMFGLISTGFGQCTSCSLFGASAISVNQNSTFTTSAQSGASYFWSVTGNLSIIGSNTGTSVVVRGNAAGTGKVSIARYRAGAVPCSFSKTVTITSGNCTFTSVSVARTGGTSCGSTIHSFRATANGSGLSGVTYNWQVFGNATIISGQGTRNVTVRSNTIRSGFSVRANVTTCGQTKTGFNGSLCPIDDCGDFICPRIGNPVKIGGNIDVKLNRSDAGLTSKAGNEVNIQIFDKFGQVVKTVNTNADQLSIETKGLKSGVYILNITHAAGEKHMLRFIIE